MLRVGACSPLATVGDPAANARATIALAQAGHEAAADLLVFPELNVTSYAIDDLHAQAGLHEATRAALAAIVEASRDLKDRKRVETGQRVSIRFDAGGCPIAK